MLRTPLLLLLLLPLYTCQSQQSIKDYLGGWSGEMTNYEAFSFKVKLEIKPNEPPKITFRGNETTTTIPLVQQGEALYTENFQDQLSVYIQYVQEESPIAFLKIGHHLAHLFLQEAGEGEWAGDWNLLINEKAPATFYLSLDANEDETYYASAFFQAPSFHYTMGENFKHDAHSFQFKEIRSRINFTGILRGDQIDLTLKFLKEQTSFTLRRLDYDRWKRGQSGMDQAAQLLVKKPNARFERLVQDIIADTLPNTHSVLIAQNGETIFEHYFDGFTENTPHDTRSVSKSVASAIIGIAIEQGHIENEQVSIKDFFAAAYPDIDWSNDKDAISLFHLLTMSSGLDIIDFGLNRMSYANEGNYQSQEDWTGFILSAPMVNPVGKEANYGSGSPHLLGAILSRQLKENPAFFIHRHLMRPMGITNYRFQTDRQNQPYFGGGWYFTPADLLKFCQLHLQEGRWQDQQLLPAEWVHKSMQKHTRLANAIDRNEYGYLFWHKTYEVNNRKIESVEARGTGGQYLFIVPELDLAVVITSGNYANNRGFQPEAIMKDYILPEFIKKE